MCSTYESYFFVSFSYRSGPSWNPPEEDEKHFILAEPAVEGERPWYGGYGGAWRAWRGRPTSRRGC
jgi:hypothetical protein